MKIMIPPIAACFLLAACTISQQAALDAAIKSGKALKISEARLLLATVCAIGEEAKQTILAGDKRFALEVLCAPE